MSLLPPSPPGGTWLPTHVQVTVLRARGLRLKGKHETSDAFTIIQLGRERYSTTVVEKSPGRAEWAEECSFELPPGPALPELQLTVMHRALIGLDKFLGQASLPLGRLLQEGRSSTDQWYKLQSKPGTKEKERGEIQASVKFTRNNMTASMFDLSMKDKPRTPFGKLKDKIKGKKKYEMESASAIVPSSVGRLDSDEEDLQRETSEKKPKSKGFFLKGKLRKTSLTGSNTSLRSNNSISSAGGANNADLSILVPEMVKKPAHRNLSTDGYDNPASPRQTHKRAFSDEVGQLSSGPIPEAKAVHNLKPKNSPVSKSSVCVNGSHVYTEELPPKTNTHVIEPFIMSRSFQNIAKKPEDVAHAVPSRSEQLKAASSGPEKVGELTATNALEDSKVSTKSIVLNQQSSKEPCPEVKPVQIATPIILSVEPKKEKQHEEAKKEDKKPKVSLFHHGSGKSENGTKTFVEKIVPTQPTNSSQICSNTDDRSKTSGWFGSKDQKDASQKPSPHPVKPISASVSETAERKQQKSGLTTAFNNGLEKLKTATTSSVHAVAPSVSGKPDHEWLKDPAFTDQAAKYYHLTHDELIHRLLQRENELNKKDEHVQELETYLDQLLVRIMDHAPTLLQVPLEQKKK